MIDKKRRYSPKSSCIRSLTLQSFDLVSNLMRTKYKYVGVSSCRSWLRGSTGCPKKIVHVCAAAVEERKFNYLGFYTVAQVRLQLRV